jgi:gliding motility-associated-like protein
MYGRIAIVAIAWFWLGHATSQNLVQNWDFSTKNPSTPQFGSVLSPIETVAFWTPNKSPNSFQNNQAGTAHKLLTGYYQILNMPNPYTGDAIGLIWFYHDLSLVSNNMQRLSIHRNIMSNQLEKDTIYCIETYVRAWTGVFGGFHYGYTHKNLGFYFTSDTALPSSEPWNNGIVPQVWNNTGYIDNDSSWRQVKGSFTAAGGEQYLFIGNFDPISEPAIQIAPSTHPWNASMIWFDAVMVYNCRDTVFSITLPDTTVCHGTAVQLLPLVQGFKLQDTVRTYTWHTPLGSFTQTDSSFLATQPGTYTLEVEINHRFTATQTITVNWLDPKPDTAFLPPSLPWCRNEQLALAVPYIDSATYSWNTGSTDTLIQAERPGYYTVTINHPCWQYTTGVELLPQNCEDLWVPNAFTPDGDGINDYFEIFGLHQTNGLPLSLTVTDRWGNLVYQNHNYHNEWDGTVGGQPLQAGVYTYRIIYYKVQGGRDYLKQGTVTIIR